MLKISMFDGCFNEVYHIWYLNRSKSSNNRILNTTYFQDCLRSLNKFAREIKGVVHCPRLGYKTEGFDWYIIERLLKQHITECKIKCLVYYFPRRMQQMYSFY